MPDALIAQAPQGVRRASWLAGRVLLSRALSPLPEMVYGEQGNNEARSPLLPQLGLGADYTYSNGYRDANGINSNETSASLQLTQ
ncbi:hypothetical protein MJL33_32345, partial [Salmonella enterica subsp. enterica serovar Kentucky]|nr:hypothetical protein [Salmonella enterica subsp. enterica serovar Kentucky]